MATVTPVHFSTAFVPASVAALITAPALTTYVLEGGGFTNQSGSAVTLTVYRVPAAGSPGTSNIVLAAFSIAAGATYVPDVLKKMVLGAGATIQAFASSASSVVMTYSGWQIV